MASEITLTASLSVLKGTLSASLALTTVRYTMTGTAALRNIQSVGTAAEAIQLGDFTSGFILIINRDATNYVELYDAAAGNVFAKLMPGECALFRVGSAAPAAKANSSACLVEYLLLAA